MSADERYDFVIVGGGPNRVALAAYVAKSGASVCVLEERPECGGACENVLSPASGGARLHGTYRSKGRYRRYRAETMLGA